jgi:hypothetical protein
VCFAPVDLSCDVLREAATSVFFRPYENYLDETFFHKFPHKMIPCIDMLCPLTRENLSCDTDCSDIVNAPNHWEMYCNPHTTDEYLCNEFYFLCCFTDKVQQIPLHYFIVSLHIAPLISN